MGDDGNQLVELEQNPQVVQLRGNGTELIERAKTLTVTSQEEMDIAAQVVSSLSDIKRNGENLRKVFVQPLNNHVSNINAFFKVFITPIETAENALRRLISNYVAEQEREAAAERDRIAKEAAAAAKKAEKAGKPVEVAPVTIAPQIQVQTSSGRLNTKKVWTYELVNRDLVPREYLEINSAKVRLAIREGERNIKGLRIFQETQTQVR